MRKPLVTVLGLTLLAVMSGCRHRKPVAAVPPPPPPPVKLKPAIPHATMADMPLIPEPTPPSVVLGGAVEPAPSRPKTTRRPTAETTAAKETENEGKQRAAAGEEPPSTTPIGQISAAPNTQGLPSSKNIGNEIQWIQQQLKSIHHTLNTKQQRTATQIQTFLAKATNALQAGDLDGAHTLTVKARVLLSELR